MPIRVLCACGKELTFPDQLAGKKVKCRDCNTVLKVPAQDAPVPAAPAPAVHAAHAAPPPPPPPAPAPAPVRAAPTPVAPPPQPAASPFLPRELASPQPAPAVEAQAQGAPGVIKIMCACLKELTFPDSLAGKKVNCPHCQKVLTLPLPKKLVAEVGQQKYDPNSPFFIKGIQHCPGCGRSYPETVQICIHCGINIKSGAALYTSAENPESSASREAPKPKEGITQRLFRKLLGRS